MKTARATLGFDLGASKILFGLFDERFGVIDEIKIKTPGAGEFARAFEACVGGLVRSAKKKKRTLMRAGLACAGDIDRRRGTLSRSTNLGASGAAGEFGHFLVAPMGPLTGSERQGVLDDFVGRNALAGAAASIAAAKRVRIVVGKLGKHAIAAGAAKMAWDRVAASDA